MTSIFEGREDLLRTYWILYIQHVAVVYHVIKLLK